MEVTAVSAASATPAMGPKVREVWPIATLRHEDTQHLPAAKVPATVVTLPPETAESVARAHIPAWELTRASTNH